MRGTPHDRPQSLAWRQRVHKSWMARSRWCDPKISDRWWMIFFAFCWLESPDLLGVWSVFFGDSPDSWGKKWLSKWAWGRSTQAWCQTMSNIVKLEDLFKNWYIRFIYVTVMVPNMGVHLKMGFSWIFPSINQAFWRSPFMEAPMVNFPKTPGIRAKGHFQTVRPPGKLGNLGLVLRSWKTLGHVLGPCYGLIDELHEMMGVWFYINASLCKFFPWLVVVHSNSAPTWPNTKYATTLLFCFWSPDTWIVGYLQRWRLETRDGLSNLLPVKWMFFCFGLPQCTGQYR